MESPSKGLVKMPNIAPVRQPRRPMAVAWDVQSPRRSLLCIFNTTSQWPDRIPASSAGSSIVLLAVSMLSTYVCTATKRAVTSRPQPRHRTKCKIKEDEEGRRHRGKSRRNRKGCMRGRRGRLNLSVFKLAVAVYYATTRRYLARLYSLYSRQFKQFWLG